MISFVLLPLAFSILSKNLMLEKKLQEMTKDVFQYLLIGECNPFVGRSTVDPLWVSSEIK